LSWRNVLSANTRKVGIELLRYWPNTLSMVGTFYAVFLMLFLGIRLVGNPATSGANTQYLIVVMVLWLLALTAMHGIGWEVTNEATRGTLEQLYMSPVGAWRILLARMTGTVLINLALVALVLVLGMLTARQRLSLDLLTLAPLLVLTTVGMLGVGFMLAGLALLFKQIHSVLQVAQFVALALVAVPVSLSPWLELLPVVRGSTMIRQAMTQGTTAGGFTAVAWTVLAVNAALYLTAGIAAYRRAERRAMRLGLLGQY
jgi:ABC-2 type transport system permease protein